MTEDELRDALSEFAAKHGVELTPIPPRGDGVYRLSKDCGILYTGRSWEEALQDAERQITGQRF